MIGNNRYRITLKMLESGAARLSACRAELGHTPQTVCRAVFVAMIESADIHPGASLARSFELSSQDPRPTLMPSGRLRKRPKGHRFTRADFDAEGKRLAGTVNGKPHYQWINNFPYLKDHHIITKT
jgi:hypothetical protein